MDALNGLAQDLVGTKESPYFVTLLSELEFDGAPTTIAAFLTIEDAEAFLSTLRPTSVERFIIEGPDGVIEKG